MIDDSFEQVWVDIKNYAKGKSTIKTLVHKEVNDIIKTNEDSIFSSEPVQNDFGFEFDLKEFSVDRADKTVFFKVSNEGSMGDRSDSRKRMAFRGL